MSKREAVVAADVAADEFERLCDSLDVELDETELDETELEAFNDIRKTLTKAIRFGNLQVTPDGLPLVVLRHPVVGVTQIPFKRPTGELIMALGDSRKKNEIEKLNLLMADLGGQPSAVFAKMDFRTDGRLCQAVTRLFLG